MATKVGINVSPEVLDTNIKISPIERKAQVNIEPRTDSVSIDIQDTRRKIDIRAFVGGKDGIEDDFAKVTDENGDYVYKGEASPGTAEHLPGWRISRYFISPTDDSVIVTFADGNAKFDNVWAEHRDLSYS